MKNENIIKLMIFKGDIKKFIKSKLRLQKNSIHQYICISSIDVKDAKIDDIDYEKLHQIREYIEVLEEYLKPSEKRLMHNKLLSLNVEKVAKISKFSLLVKTTGRYYLKKIKLSIQRKVLLDMNYCIWLLPRMIKELCFLGLANLDMELSVLG